MMIEQIALAVASAAVYSLVFYAKTKASDPDEEFNKFKFGATLIVGIGVGVSFQLSGVDFNQQDIANQLAAYAGTVALLESMLKVVWRQFLKDYVGQ